MWIFLSNISKLKTNSPNVFGLMVPKKTARFTKWHFVRHKNPQKLGDTYIIPFIFLSLNLDSVFKFIQRPTNAGHFSFFFKIYLVFLMIFLFVSSNCRKFCQYSRNLLSATFLFSSRTFRFPERRFVMPFGPQTWPRPQFEVQAF